MIDIDMVIHSYIVAMLWSESCNGTAPTSDGHKHSSDNPEDCDVSLESIGYDVSDLSDSARAEVEADVRAFVAANEADLVELLALSGVDETDIGHNFFLNRNGHGVGFWDRGWGELGRRLDKAADAYGTQGAYVSASGDRGVEGEIDLHG